MKLIIEMQNGRAIPLVNNPSQNVSRDGGTVNSVTFTLGEDLGLKANETLHGHLTWMSDDDFLMRDYYVRDFLRYEYTKTEWTDECEKKYQEKYGELPEDQRPARPDNSYRLMLTTEPVPEPIEPPVLPEPEPPTEEELLAMAKRGKDTQITSMRDTCTAMGIDVQTEFGVEHFNLGTDEKIMLLGIYSMVQSGMTSFPYHSIGANNVTNLCTVYSDADIAKIATGAFAFITFHESYCNMMVQWLERETDREVVETIKYGAELPDDLQSYLMMIMMSAMGDNEDAMANLPVNMPMSGSQITLPPEPEVPEYPEYRPGETLPDGSVIGPDGRPMYPGMPVYNEIQAESLTISGNVNVDLDPEEGEQEPTVIGPVIREEAEEEDTSDVAALMKARAAGVPDPEPAPIKDVTPPAYPKITPEAKEEK